MPSRRPGPTAEPGGASAAGDPGPWRDRSAAAGREAGRRRPWILPVLPLLLLSAAACAKEEPPPGAAPDQTPPSVREIRPADGSVVPDFDGALTIRFDEPIERPRGLARQIEASPVGTYQVDLGFDRIQIRPEDGWLRGAVYQIRLPVAVSDLLNNEREGPLAVTFSTGPPISPTRVTGRIFDRVTREPREGARALFLAREGDSIPYGAVADTGGRFELRALPPGEYRSYAFRDLNGNRTLERRLEPWDSTTIRLPDSTSTAEIRLSILEPDSTPPRLAAAEATDSVAVELTFDDHLDPAQELGPEGVTILDPDGDTVAVAAVGLTRAAVGLEAAEGDEEGRRPAAPPGAAERGLPDRDSVPGRAPPADTAPPDTAPAGPEAPDSLPPAGGGQAGTDTAAPADTMTAPEDTLPAPGDTTGAPGDTAAADTLPLPSRTVLVRTERSLQDSVRYRVRARGFRNLRGLVGGGDTSFVYAPPPDTAAPADTVPSDTAADRDTARRDTAVAPDTAPPADTAAPPDTAAGPDSVPETTVPDSSARPDTPGSADTAPDTARRAGATPGRGGGPAPGKRAVRGSVGAGEERRRGGAPP